MMNIFEFAATVSMYPTSDMIYFLSDWGHVITVFSIFATCKAQMPGSQNHWPYWACISTELAIAMNMVITPLFWLCLAPMIFPHLKWSGYDLYVRIRYTCVHSIPMLTSLINILISNQKFLSRDWKFIFSAGQVYLVCNYIGTMQTGHSIYPYGDWTSIPFSVAFYTAISLVATVAYYIVARITEYFYVEKN